jgi:threonine aldolase
MSATDEMIDLRSDTQTRPSPAMREAMASAVVGDEQKREDPTVLALERAAAAFVGQAEAVYLPTATMANEIALVILGKRGSELIVEDTAHIVISELGGPALYAGLLARRVSGTLGRITPDGLRALVDPRDPLHSPQPSVVAVENSHNAAGGTAWPLDELVTLVGTARELGLATHLDGARLANAAIAIGRRADEIGRLFDTVTLCFSKGLGAPLGAVIAGSHELMARARIEKHRFGGAMRQAGIVAAAALYALEHNVERLAEDHARARRLAEGWSDAGVPIDLERVQTNFVQIDVGALGWSPREALAALEAAGVLLSGTVHATVVRAVTHLDVDDADVERALELLPQALLTRGSASYVSAARGRSRG